MAINTDSNYYIACCSTEPLATSRSKPFQANVPLWQPELADWTE